MAMERQSSWGALAALDMFLGGAGAGAFSTGFVLTLLDKMEWLAVTGLLAGPVLVGAGMVLLLLEAGSPLRSYRLFSGLASSWMSRGSLAQLLFIVLGLGYAVPGLWLTQWPASGAGLTIGVSAVLLSLAVAVYYGIILGQARSIPLWSSSALPVLSFFTALTTGLGLLLAVSPAYTALYSTTETGSALGVLGTGGIALIAGNLVTVWYLVGQHPNATYAASVRSMRTAVIGNVVCLLLAGTLLGLGLTLGATSYSPWLSSAAGVSLLVSGIVIRYAILKAGYYAPVQVLL